MLAGELALTIAAAFTGAATAVARKKVIKQYKDAEADGIVVFVMPAVFRAIHRSRAYPHVAR